MRHPDVGPSDLAVKSWVISPAEERVSTPALFFSEGLSRVTGFASYSFREQEFDRLTPRTCQRRATVLHELKDVVICGGNLYAGPYKYRMHDQRRLLSRITAEVDDGGVPCTSWLGGMYFGHWLAEDTAQKMIAPRFGPTTVLDLPQTAHQTSYDELFDITQSFLPTDCRVRKITFIETDIFSTFRAEGWAAMTARIRARYPHPPHLGCMLLRGTSGARRVMVNEAEIAERLRALGFRIVDPATASLDDILAATSGARVVVGVEGSQLAHGFHCLEEGGAMLVLQPPDRFGCIDKDRCDYKGVRYAFSVGHAVPEGFRIDTDELHRLLDRLLAELREFSPAGLQ